MRPRLGLGLLHLLAPSVCPACDQPRQEGEILLCPACARGLVGLGTHRGAITALAYEGTGAELIRRLKFEARRDGIPITCRPARPSRPSAPFRRDCSGPSSLAADPRGRVRSGPRPRVCARPDRRTAALAPGAPPVPFDAPPDRADPQGATEERDGELHGAPRGRHGASRAPARRREHHGGHASGGRGGPSALRGSPRAQGGDLRNPGSIHASSPCAITQIPGPRAPDRHAS